MSGRHALWRMGGTTHRIAPVRPRTRIKICGITQPRDARLAGERGVDAVGLNFFRGSPRFVTLARSKEILAELPPLLCSVGVFVGETVPAIREIADGIGLAAVQLHQSEPPQQVEALAPLPVIRAFAWRGEETAKEIDDYVEACRRRGRLPSAILLDTHRKDRMGGTGESWSWTEAAGWRSPLPVILAGGLHPGNVAAAIRTIRPYAVDVASGVESEPGIKDQDKLARFVDAVREADEKD